ncbi:MAG: SRPBCC domain-containing protein [Chitinivibrionales bacterium]|nr:SRPBCC domain-containing protein [Chitinivibrionales bacterium]
MRQLSESIEISASPERIWKILADFDTYPQWNPFIRSIKGDMREGNRIRVILHPPGKKDFVVVPKVLSCKARSEFIWLGHLLVPGIFDGEHIFRIERIAENRTMFTQKELFNGLFLPFIWPSIKENTREAFIMMNQALKKKSENS